MDSPTRGESGLTAARASQHAAAAASAALTARRAGYPLAVAAALANSHQRNLVLAGNAAAGNSGIPCSVAVSVGGHVGGQHHVSLTSSMNAALAQAAAAAQQQQQQHQQQQAAVASSPTLHGLSP